MSFMGHLTGQFKRYMGHVTKNVGGIYDPKTYDMTVVNLKWFQSLQKR
jgi:hypothetical protein